MLFDKYISWPVFLVSFILGCAYMYGMGPLTKPVYIYPTPENVNNLLFKDGADTCFKFYTIETAEPADKNRVKDSPIQI
jgi:hypothetical protein